MLAADGTRRAKKRAVVAVARKLSVLLLSLWKNQTLFRPFPQVMKIATRKKQAHFQFYAVVRVPH